MLGPRGGNPHASTTEVRQVRTVMRARLTESATREETGAALLAPSNEVFRDTIRDQLRDPACPTRYIHTRVKKLWLRSDG